MGETALSSRAKLLRAAVWLTQLGLSVLLPPVALLLLAVWLRARFGWGVWVLMVALLAGLLSSFCSALSFYRIVTRRQKRDKMQDPPGFNRHE